jgi:hypothetical protein
LVTEELLEPPDAPETEVVVEVLLQVLVPGGVAGAGGAGGATGAIGVATVEPPALVEPVDEPPLCAIVTLVLTEVAADETVEVCAAGATDKAITLLKLLAADFSVEADAVKAPPLEAASVAKLAALWVNETPGLA